MSWFVFLKKLLIQLYMEEYIRKYVNYQEETWT